MCTTVGGHRIGAYSSLQRHTTKVRLPHIQDDDYCKYRRQNHVIATPCIFN